MRVEIMRQRGSKVIIKLVVKKILSQFPHSKAKTRGTALCQTTLDLESDLQDTVDWGRKSLVHFNAGKT